eukprot:3933205-Rhodomonas_salina.4
MEGREGCGVTDKGHVTVFLSVVFFPPSPVPFLPPLPPPPSRLPSLSLPPLLAPLLPLSACFRLPLRSLRAVPVPHRRGCHRVSRPAPAARQDRGGAVDVRCVPQGSHARRDAQRLPPLRLGRV